MIGAAKTEVFLNHICSAFRKLIVEVSCTAEFKYDEECDKGILESITESSGVVSKVNFKLI